MKWLWHYKISPAKIMDMKGDKNTYIFNCKFSIITILILLIASRCLYGVSVSDRVGDFDDTDVMFVQVDVQAGAAIFTIMYAGEVIGSLYGGAGGIIGIDSDRNPATGLDNSRGFDCQIVYNVLALAPSAQVNIWTGPNAGSSINIGVEHGNGTYLAHTDRTITLVVPLQYLNTNGDFDFVLYATGLFSSGDKWDRVPDQGVARSLTGEISIFPIAGNKEPRAYQGNNLIQSVNTSIEGENAVWMIQMATDLPGSSFSDNSMVMELLIDVDRKLETGIESSNIPFLPFGPDRVVQCTLTPNNASSVNIITAIKENGERVTVGGGAGVNDLNLTFDKRQARLEVPLWLIGLNSAAFDWMLVAISTQDKTPPDIFLNTGISFDTGNKIIPLELPPQATVVTDPIDAKAPIQDAAGKEIGSLKLHTLPNSELRECKAGLRDNYLMIQIAYENPIVTQPEYFTSVNIIVPGDGGASRNFLISINWNTYTGGQALLRELTTGADITRVTSLNQCLANIGKQVFLLLPAPVFGKNVFDQVQFYLETHQIAYSVVPGKTSPKPSGGDKDSIRYGAHIGLVAGGQTTQILDRLPNNGSISPK